MISPLVPWCAETCISARTSEGKKLHQGVFNANAAPYPDRPGLAYGYNAEGYRKLGVAGATMNDPRTYALWYGGSALGGLGLYGAGAFDGGLTTLGIGTEAGGELAPSAGQVAQGNEYLQSRGRASVEKAIHSLERRLAQHEADLANYQSQGGYTSKTASEIRNFKQLIQAYKQVLGR